MWGIGVNEEVHLVLISTCNMHLTLDLVVCFVAVFHNYINCLVHA